MPVRAYLRLLGGARIDSAEGVASPVRGRAAHRRRLALLALLAAAPGNRLTRERILAWLWPDLDSESGRRNLSEALHVLRREFGEDALVSVGDDVRLSSDVIGSDLADFRAACEAGDDERAVSLYGGPFLDGWYVADAREFDEWAEGERAVCAASYMRSLESLAERHERDGDFRSAVVRWRERARLSPDASLPAARLATAMASAGERADAIRLLERHIERLRAEGMPVESQVTELLERLRRESHAPFEVPGPRASPRPVEAPSSHTLSTAPVAEPRRRVGRFVGAGVIGLFLVIGAFIWKRPATVVDKLDPNRLAVLYFEHQPPDSIGYLADGITGKLIDELSGVTALKVVSRSGVLHYRGAQRMPPLDSIAAAFGAGLLVEGSLQKRDNKVRVSMSLVDARTGTRVGAPRVIERPLDESVVFALQDDVARELAIALRRRLGSEVRLLATRSGTTSPKAQELSDRADYAWNTAWSLTNHGLASDLPAAARALSEADSLFDLAARADPRWRLPAVQRGWVARDRARLVGADSARMLMRLAVDIANQVLARDSLDARALELRGTAEWSLGIGVPGGAASPLRIASVRRDLARALSLDSTRVIAAAKLSQVLRVTSNDRDDRVQAMELARKAYEQDAFLASAEGAIRMLYRASLALGQVDSARAWCDRGRAFSPGDWQFEECRLNLMRVDLKRWTPAQAWGAVARVEELDPSERAARSGRAYQPVYRRLVAAAVTAAGGDADSARAVLARALREVDSDRDMRVDVKHDETLVRLALGERAEAMDALRIYLRHRPAYYGVVLGDVAFRQFGLDSASIARALALR